MAMLSSVATPASSEWLPPLEEESSEEDDFSLLLGLLGLMQFLKEIHQIVNFESIPGYRMIHLVRWFRWVD